MFEKQIKGLIVIFLILAIIPFILPSNFFFNYAPPFFTDQQNDMPLIIEVCNENRGKGIYFVKPGTTANQLLEMTGIDVIIEKDFMLENGMKLTVDSDSAKKVSLAEIDNSRRLALGMPIDINRASENDLLLIPGIGEISVQKILELRRKKVRFKNIEELMETEGIKEKKLAKLKQYLYLQK
jgi:competence protein ComEA